MTQELVRRWIEDLDRNGDFEGWQLHQALKAVQILMEKMVDSADRPQIDWNAGCRRHDFFPMTVKRGQKGVSPPKSLFCFSTSTKGPRWIALQPGYNGKSLM